MSRVASAVSLIRQIAADNKHGYLWGGNGPVDFDCSGLINYVWQQVGVPVNAEVRNTTHTMRQYYIRHGFSDVTTRVNLKTGAGLKAGDVLVNTENHTAMYVGGGKIVQARANYDGTTGDSSGQEIREQAYYNYPWTTVLRYTGDGVASGPVSSAASVSSTAAQYFRHIVKLPELSRGSKGETVKAAQLLLLGNDCSVGLYGADGDFGPGTLNGVLKFQRDRGLDADGIIGGRTWAALLGVDAD